MNLFLPPHSHPFIRVLLSNPSQKALHSRLVAQTFERVVFVVQFLVGKQRVYLAMAGATNANRRRCLARLEFRARREMMFREMFQIAVTQIAVHKEWAVVRASSQRKKRIRLLLVSGPCFWHL